MNETGGLFRAEFHDDNPDGQFDAARFRCCCTMVANWPELLEAVERYQQEFWVEIFDETTGERLVGPISPGEMGDSLMRGRGID